MAVRALFVGKLDQFCAHSAVTVTQKSLVLGGVRRGRFVNEPARAQDVPRPTSTNASWQLARLRGSRLVDDNPWERATSR